MKKRICLAFNFDGDSTLKTFSLLPIAANEANKEIIKNCNRNAEEAYEPLCDKIINKDGEHLLTFVFAPSGSPTHLIVSDDECQDDGYIYEDEEFEINPSYGIMSMEQAEEEYTEENYGEEFAEELKSYKSYLTDPNPIVANNPIEKGIAQSWEGLINNTVNDGSFIPAAMSNSLKAVNKSFALLSAEGEIHDSTISFEIDLQDGEEFDTDKLGFINFDQEYEDYSSLFDDELAEDLILMNAIIYNGKIYFAQNNQMEFGDNEGDVLYDFVNEDMESETPEVKKKVKTKGKMANTGTSSTPEKALSLDEQMALYPREIQEFINNLVEIDRIGFGYGEEKNFKKLLSRYPEIEEVSTINFAEAYIRQKFDEKHDKKGAEMCKELQYAFETYLKEKDDTRLILKTLKAKTEFANNKKVQETLKTIESAIESLKRNAEDKEVEKSNLDAKKEKEKARLEAEKIKLEIESLKQEKELEALRKIRDAEMKARQEEIRARHEQNMKELKDNFKKHKKGIIIGVLCFFIILALCIIPLILFGPK